MDTKNQIKHRIIDKILASQNEVLLSTIDQLIDATSDSGEKVVLTLEQIEMLEMSEKDLMNDATILQEEVNEADLAWLKEK